MNINKRFLFLASLYSLLSIFIFPGTPYKYNPDIYAYGFPHPYFVVSHTNQWLVTGTQIQLLYFAFNALYVYILLLIISKLMSMKRG